MIMSFYLFFYYNSDVFHSWSAEHCLRVETFNKGKHLAAHGQLVTVVGESGLSVVFVCVGFFF